MASVHDGRASETRYGNAKKLGSRLLFGGLEVRLSLVCPVRTKQRSWDFEFAAFGFANWEKESQGFGTFLFSFGVRGQRVVQPRCVRLRLDSNFHARCR